MYVCTVFQFPNEGSYQREQVEWVILFILDLVPVQISSSN